ncbi:MAG TPA: TIGR00730 family Rossman fold protein [Spirochaetota bacterium]|nr:TIGR00730 family Rossman fold protein [Spirochaetota bacterium]
MKSVCVYCSSSSRVLPAFIEEAHALSRALSRAGLELVYGGADVGLMGIVAAGVKDGGGRVTGVIPEKLARLGWKGCDELVVTPDMRSRKQVMEERSDGFVTLPGGFGTLEEALEIITLKQLQYHAKPVVLVNTAGFFDPLAAMFERIYTDGFARREFSSLYHLAHSSDEAVDYLMVYSPPPPIQKWGMERTAGG